MQFMHTKLALANTKHVSVIIIIHDTLAAKEPFILDLETP